jgi:putative toxin-antitoxin system antitoxin component (TIGR02293 family)
MARDVKDIKYSSLAIPQIAKRVALLASQGLTVEEIKWELLGGKLFSPSMPETALEFYDVVNNGIPKVSVDILAEVMEIPMTKMAHLLNLSYKTLTRKNKKDLLDPIVSSHTYEMTDVIAKGLEVFEDGEKLKRWLHKENRALKGKKPFDLLNTPTGIRLINQVLGRLEEGIYS